MPSNDVSGEPTRTETEHEYSALYVSLETSETLEAECESVPGCLEASIL